MSLESIHSHWLLCLLCLDFLSQFISLQSTSAQRQTNGSDAQLGLCHHSMHKTLTVFPCYQIKSKMYILVLQALTAPAWTPALSPVAYLHISCAAAAPWQAGRNKASSLHVYTFVSSCFLQLPNCLGKTCPSLKVFLHCYFFHDFPDPLKHLADPHHFFWPIFAPELVYLFYLSTKAYVS